MTKLLCCLFLLLSTFVCAQQPNKAYILLLGVAQDGGYPHMGCQKQCCAKAWQNPAIRGNVVSLALVDPLSHKWWLFEATPDIKQQLHQFQEITKDQYNFLPDGIFITHAHIGHYTGLTELGREVINARSVPVYTLPKLAHYLESNGPWSQLVNYKNMDLRPLQADTALQLPDGISITAFTVPHRDEYSETAGFRIVTPIKKYLFIPDINKWEIWNRDIVAEVKKVDIALLDATFYSEKEMPGIKYTSVPHPLVTETMQLFGECDAYEKQKVHFIHFNHNNPLLWNKEAQKSVIEKGFNIAVQGQQL